MRDWLSARARVDPDSLAVLDTDTGDRVTYAELDDRVEDYAASLASSNIGSGDRIGALLTRGIGYVTVLWAVFRTGGTLVPLDIQETPGTIRSIIDRVELDHLVVEDSTAETGQIVAPADLDVSTVGGPGSAFSTVDSRTGPSPPAGDIDLDETCAIMFTSGTSGDPKGVRLTPRNFGTSAAGSAFRLGVEPDDRWLLTLPMYHMGGLSIPIRAAIYGTAVVIEPTFDPRKTARRMHADQITGVSLVPTMLRRLLDDGWDPDGLRFALVGGAPTPEDLARQAVTHGVPLYTTYGMTETTSQVATATPEEVASYPGTVGRPLRVASVSILDVDDTTGADTRRRGEIAVSGPIVSPGYLEDAEGSRGNLENVDDRRGNLESFDGRRGNLEDADDRRSDVFRTGDYGYLDDGGRLYVEGRRDDVIITGGENVHPRDVETRIRSHPDVESVAVVGIPDPEWGERVGALVVSTGAVGPAALFDYLDGRLAPYKVPKTIATVDHLPRTPSGTVDREATRERLRAAGKTEEAAEKSEMKGSENTEQSEGSEEEVP